MINSAHRDTHKQRLLSLSLSPLSAPIEAAAVVALEVKPLAKQLVKPSLAASLKLCTSGIFFFSNLFAHTPHTRHLQARAHTNFSMKIIIIIIIVIIPSLSFVRSLARFHSFALSALLVLSVCYAFTPEALSSFAFFLCLFNSHSRFRALFLSLLVL